MLAIFIIMILVTFSGTPSNTLKRRRQEYAAQASASIRVISRLLKVNTNKIKELR